MKALLAVFFIGVLIGIIVFSQPSVKETITGRAIEDCYVENELCECNKEECICGNRTVSRNECIN